MADEVPVCDVLCEAMEYLSKLGSNLRARSENLKEKRIRKDKLKNFHAVQKAADKVLLICQLSKKSLENVECGVRKVLTLVNSGQDIGDPAVLETPTSSSAVQETEKYRYFKYRSYKLKVAKKVPVKHYLSATVMARNMPLSMHDSYPVYHNCKLYRARKRKEKDVLRKSIEKPENINFNKSNYLLNQLKTDGSNIETKLLESNISSNVREILVKDIDSEGSQNFDEHKNKSHNERSFSCSEVNNSLSPTKLTNNKKERLSKSGEINRDHDDNLQKRRSSKSNLKKIRVIDDDSSDNNNEVQDEISKDCNKIMKDIKSDKSKLCETNSSEQLTPSDSLTQNNKQSKSDDSDAENIGKNTEEASDTSKKNTEAEEESVKPLIKCVNINKLLKPDIAENKLESPKKKSKIKNSSVSDDESSARNKENIKHTNKVNKKEATKLDEDFWALKRKEVSAFVSKQFAINVTRLPELSENFLLLHNLRKIVQSDIIICELSKKEECSNKKKGDETKTSNGGTQATGDRINVVKNALLNDSDSEKSDVSANKSPLPLAEIEKTVQDVICNDIDITNTTLLSFAEINKTIEKVLKDSQNGADYPDVEKSRKGEEKVTNDATNNTDNVKGALLNDSDSDTNKRARNRSNDDNQDSETVKNDNSLKQTLLAESDSEHIEINNSQSVKDGDSKNCENVTSENNKTKTESQVEQNVVEPNKSDHNSEITPSKKKKHKRKNMMESMHAKKMLLTYSSSSDTEDEQLRNALKEIKDSLLQGASSSDDDKKKKTLRVSSSEDDEDIDLKRIRKKRKSIKGGTNDDSESCSKSSSAHLQHNDSDQASQHSRKSEESSRLHSKSTSKKMGRSRAQPGGSSQNSDSQDPNDKDIDGLTNLNSLAKNRRRRDSASTTNTTDTNSTKRSARMGKTPLISEDNMLKAESSSEAGSVIDSDPGEELPSISVTGLNGSGVDHLAKDDLLDESDTSASHRGDSDDIKKTDDSDEETVKSRRRKAQLISSDSEAGSSRRNIDKTIKLSDFEDSEDESSEPAKRSKRKNKEDESDASAGSSSNDGSKKKRRRIKQIDSDVSGSDTENEGRNKHGRKNIRKVMGKNQLEEATKKAAREEKERIARIAERQKVYNNLEFDESGKPDEVVLEKVVLDFDPETKEPLIQVDRGLVKKLKPHQANGIKFMWDACFESVKRIKKDKGSGCILAHCMGLGKTLQVVSLTHTLLTHSSLTSVNRVLVVCPLSTVLNWVNEFKMWLKHAENEYDVDVYELSRHKQNSERAFQLQQWFEHGGVCVLGYEMFRNLSADNSKKFKKKMLRNFQESLVDPGPDLVVCDEGHLLKNEKTSLSQSMNRVKTRRRIVLTGTPLQNNLKEYYCMVQFVKPNLLGKYNEYLNRFVNPITNGQYTDSTEHDIRIMKRRSHVLHKMLDGAVQRRDYGVLAPFLPPKHEYVLFITLTDVQVKLYQYYLDNYSRRPLPGKSSGFLFPDFQSLQRIWTHPLVLKYNSERYEIMQQKKREREEEDSEGSLVDFIDDDSTPDESSTEESSDDLSDMSDDSRKKSKKKKSAKKSKAKDSKVSTRRGTRANPVEMEDDVPAEVVELKNENPTEWWIKLVEEEELEDMRNSHKLVLLFDILRQCETIGDKLLVFSQSLYSLDLIEHFLGKVDEATQDGRIDEKLGGHVGSWSPGVDYFRLDGSTSCENRSIWCKNFNREDNPRARLFLISTRAGGLGINLVAANRVVIFDVSWNPSHDVQSIFRVYRFGQKKPCYIYRFLAMGTMEEKIYERQVTKQAISKRVIDEQQIDRHYAENDLAELYKFEASPPVPRPIPPLPKDRLFAEMLREHEAQIYKYHEHDSLLENKEEETLSEEERKAAWEDFENEKNRPPPAPFPSAWPMHNGMVPGLLAQQQQQLAYAALASMLRKDMPNINDNQIRDMLPLIYNANPALMQKMSEIYKYTQPGMMNPGMMNPVMGSVTGGSGGGMGGTSGLQYEPPWQRQHQQQQQMRLQQLMQQNQMGAKYYAGGLGSRDPVAMALQQQRAREIMSGERGRPRGRPPLQPRAPPPQAHQDIVNLDSD